MIKQLYFVTGNDYKFQIAQAAFKNSGFKLLQKKLDTPEIQSHDLGEIAAFSAAWAARKIKRPIFLTDAGCFIEALNGFPGPFLKYVNHCLTSRDYLKLMAGQRNRKVVFKDCLAYCEPNKKPIIFYSSAAGKIALKPGKRGSTSISEIFIPQGFDQTESEIPRLAMIEFWNKHITNISRLLDYLKK